MELLLEWVYQYRFHRNQRTGKLSQVIVVDEAKTLLDASKEDTDGGIPEISQLISKIRTFETGLIVADQEPAKLLDTVKANTNTKILLPTSDKKQRKVIAASMGLNKHQRHQARHLAPGEAILTSNSEGPLRIDIYDPDISDTITDNQVESHLQQYPFITSIFRKGEAAEYLGNKVSAEAETLEEPETPSVNLSDDAGRLLKALALNPFAKLTDQYKELYSSPSHGVDAKNELLQNELVEPEQINTGRAKRKLFEITEKGREHLEQEENLELHQKGRGGIKHRYWQHRLKNHLEENGWAAKLEELDADIYANNGEHQIAVEIALSSRDREIDHVQKHLERGFDHIIIGAGSKAIQDKLVQKLEENKLNPESVDIHVLQNLQEMALDPSQNS
jgi:DNA-binding MarR family transcriptional regulator